MPADFSFELQGAEQLLNRLNNLSTRFKKRSVKRAARKAMIIVRDAARQNAKGLDDRLSKQKIFKNIVLQESGNQGKKVGGVVMKVGVKGGASYRKNSESRDGLSGGDTRYWRFVELGTSAVAARPFMRPALRQNIQAVTDKFMAELNAEIALSLSESA